MFGWMKRKDIKLVDAKAEGSPYKKFCALKKRSPIKIKTREKPFEIIFEYPQNITVHGMITEDGKKYFKIEDGTKEEIIDNDGVKGRILNLKIFNDLLNGEAEVNLRDWAVFVQKAVDAGWVESEIKIKKGRLKLREREKA